MTITHDDLSDGIRAVLASASTGKGSLSHYVTAYQIFERLPETLRAKLVATYGEPGQGAGKHFTAVSRIAQVARDVSDYDYMDARGLSFLMDEGEEGAQQTVLAGYPVIGIYRARRTAGPA